MSVRDNISSKSHASCFGTRISFDSSTCWASVKSSFGNVRARLVPRNLRSVRLDLLSSFRTIQSCPVTARAKGKPGHHLVLDTLGPHWRKLCGSRACLWGQVAGVTKLQPGTLQGNVAGEDIVLLLLISGLCLALPQCQENIDETHILGKIYNFLQ